jgi:hypothetical protein
MATNVEDIAEAKDIEGALTNVKLLLDGRGVDWFLQELVRFANNSSDFEFGITLHVEGAVISGVLIGAPTYFDLFAKSFTTEPKDGEKNWLYDWIIEQKSMYEEPEGQTMPPPNYVHLRDARTFSVAGAIPQNEGVLWRGKISAVGGFNLGRLSVETKSS